MDKYIIPTSNVITHNWMIRHNKMNKYLKLVLDDSDGNVITHAYWTEIENADQFDHIDTVPDIKQLINDDQLEWHYYPITSEEDLEIREVNISYQVM